jgi:hypothetical protein
MKRKNALALVMVGVVTLTFAALAIEGHVSKGPKVLLLKSQGQTIAELRVQAGTQLELTGSNPSVPGHSDYDLTTGRLSASGGVVLKIRAGTTNLVTVTADEVESVPEPK